jgi:hypothetical protein
VQGGRKARGLACRGERGDVAPEVQLQLGGRSSGHAFIRLGADAAPTPTGAGVLIEPPLLASLYYISP